MPVSFHRHSIIWPQRSLLSVYYLPEIFQYNITVLAYRKVPEALPDDWQLSKIVRELVPEMGADEVQLYYSIVTQAREQLHLAPDPQAGFTMMLLRLLAFAPEHFQANSVKK